MDLKLLPLEWLPVVTLASVFLALSLIERLKCVKGNGNNNSQSKLFDLIIQKIDSLDKRFTDELKDLRKEINELKLNFYQHFPQN